MADVSSASAGSTGSCDGSSSGSVERVKRVPLARKDPAEYCRRVAALYASSGPAIVGNVLEWYDWTVFGYMEDILGSVLVGGSQLGTWLVFAIPFAVRPLGSVFFGWLADRFGRRVSLNAAVWGMASSTVLQGCLLPGSAASVPTLCALRLLSGLSAGGEAAGVNTYMAEVGGRGGEDTLVAAVGVNNVSGSLAFFAANLVALAVHQLPSEQQLAWAWRLPFLLAAPVGLASVLLRRRMAETEAFLSMQRRRGGPGKAARGKEPAGEQQGLEAPTDSESEQAPRPQEDRSDGAGEEQRQAAGRSACLEDARATLLVLVVVAAINSCNYLPLYLVSWLQEVAGLSASAALGLAAVSKLVQILMTLPASFAGDSFGATATMLAGGCCTAVAAVPSMLLIMHLAEGALAGGPAFRGAAGLAAAAPDRVYAAALLLLGMVMPALVSFYLVPSNAYMTSLFPAARRGRGAGVGLGLASVAGGLTPMICTALARRKAWLPGAFVALLALPSLLALLWSRRAAARGALRVHQRRWLF